MFPVTPQEPAMLLAASIHQPMVKPRSRQRRGLVLLRAVCLWWHARGALSGAAG